MLDKYLPTLYQLIGQQPPPDSLRRELLNFSPSTWGEFLEEVRDSGLTTLVSAHLKKLAVFDSIPDSYQQNMHAAVLTNVARNTIFLHKAGMILNAFNQAEIPAIGLKGVYLLDNIYQDISLRAMSDIDLLLKKEDILKALKVCENLGYEPTTYFNIDDENLDIKHVPPLKSEDGSYLELHWTILEENAPFSIDVDGLWARAVPATIADHQALALSPEDLILHLCMHLSYQHQFNIGLRGLFDIEMALTHFKGEINWHKLITLAQSWGATRVLWVSLKLVSDFFIDHIPPEVMDQIQPHQLESWILPEARSQLLLGQRHSQGMTPDLAKFAAEKSVLNRLRLVWQRIFIPKQRLARLYNVPATSFWIYAYYLRRIADLLREYHSSVTRILKRDPTTLICVEAQQASQRLTSWMRET